MLLLALAKIKGPRAIEAAVKALADDDLIGHALIALRKLKPQRSQRLIDRVEKLQEHPNEWVRKEAIKTLKVLNQQH